MLAAIRGERLQLHSMGQLGAAQKILIAVGHGPEFFVRPIFLNIGFYQGRILLNHLHLGRFLRNDAADHLVERCRRLLRRSREWHRCQCQNHPKSL